MQIAIVMDPISGITYQKDTSLALLLAAAERGWSLYYMEQQNLYLRDGKAGAVCRPLAVHADPHHWYDLGQAEHRRLAEFDLLLMRKDPPVNERFVHSCMILDQAEREGCRVINRPATLLRYNEKLFAQLFPHLQCPTLVSASRPAVEAFIDEYGDVILKPLDGMGGASIFRLRQGDPNRGVILETMLAGGRQTMAQQFLPAISEGDKRILVVEGEALPWGLARIPKDGESRGNLAVGGRGVGFELEESDRRIAAEVAPLLKREGVFLAGLDVIGDRLTEINITSPTCVQEISRAFDQDIAGQIIDRLAATHGG